MGTRVLLPEYFFNLYFFEYSSTFKIKVLVLVLEYLGLVLVPNTAYLQYICNGFSRLTVLISSAKYRHMAKQ